MRALKFLAALIIIALIGLGGMVLFAEKKPSEDVVRAGAGEAIEIPETPAQTADNSEVTAPAETTEAPTEPEPAVEPAAATKKYLITPNDDSIIMWTGYKPIGPREGGFASFEGTVTVTGDDLETTEVSVTIDINSLFSDSKILTDYIKRPGFFDIEKYTEASFQSASVKKNGDTYDVTGNFTMCGNKKALTFPATIELRDDGLYTEAEFVINRFDWGMDASGYQDSIVNKEVKIYYEILAEPAEG